jgi:hypothetical protein
MIVRPWEIWKARPHGVAQDHWFVILAGEERLQSPTHNQINGLACYTLRGSIRSTDVVLNSADGFQARTVCQCDLIYLLEKKMLHSCLGLVSYERQQAIKRKLIEVFRIIPA